MKKNYSSQDYIKEVEQAVKREEIRAMLEDDPRRQKEIRAKISGKKKLLANLRAFFSKEIEYR